MPNGYYIKFELLSNHYKGKTHKDENKYLNISISAQIVMKFMITKI